MGWDGMGWEEFIPMEKAHCEKFVVIATRKENGEDVEDDERV